MKLDSTFEMRHMENGELRDLTLVPDDYIVMHHKTDMAKRLNDKYVAYEV